MFATKALKGNNVVNRSENMPWYDGQSLMHQLENVHVASDRDLADTRSRCSTSSVRSPTSSTTTAATRAGGGGLKPGDEVLVLPSGMTSKIEVTVRLEEDVDVSRGDTICRPQNAPSPARTSTR